MQHQSMQVHGKKAVVNFRLSSGEIQWQPRNKRGVSNSSAETSCPSFGARSHPGSYLCQYFQTASMHNICVETTKLSFA